MKTRSLALVTFIATASLAGAAEHASGNPEDGEKVFRKCRACHTIENADGEAIQKGGRTGPNLYGVFDRTAGTYEGFNYSDYMVAAGEKGLAWNEADFTAYVADPSGFLGEYLGDDGARGKMTFKLPDAEDAANVWAYLVSVGPASE